MILVFTDLDGTLLDHETYSYAAAKEALAVLKARSIPLILASSKTEAEMRPLSHGLGLNAPMIVENGAGICGLNDTALGKPCYGELRQIIEKLPSDLRNSYEGFGDWSAEEIAKQTGLPLDAARLAAQRQFSEPGHWSGSDEAFARFTAILNENGFQAVRGGRFTTLMPKTSKAEAMKKLIGHFSQIANETITAIALGDAPNDVAMLEAADRGVIIANPAHAALPALKGETEGRIIRSSQVGPEGWNMSVLELIAMLEKPRANAPD